MAQGWDVISMFMLHKIVTSILLANSLLTFQLACSDEASSHFGEAHMAKN